MKRLIKLILNSSPTIFQVIKFICLNIIHTFSRFKWLSLKKRNVINLELGSGPKAGTGDWVTVDQLGADISWDLRNGIPLDTGSVAKIYSSHLLEHIHEREEFLEKVLCLLKKGGKIIIAVPQERIRGDGTLFTIFINALRGIFINPHVVKLVYEDLLTLMAKVNVKTQSKIYTNYLYPFMSSARKWHSFSLVIIGEKSL